MRRLIISISLSIVLIFAVNYFFFGSYSFFSDNNEQDTSYSSVAVSPIMSGGYVPLSAPSGSAFTSTLDVRAPRATGNLSFSGGKNTLSHQTQSRVKSYSPSAMSNRAISSNYRVGYTTGSHSGLHLSSGATTKSVGGGMNRISYYGGTNRGQQYAIGSAVNSFSRPRSNGSLRNDSYSLNNINWSGLNRNYSRDFTFRGSGLDDVYPDWVLDFLDLQDPEGITDNGDGTFTVTEDWVAELYTYLASIGVTPTDDRYSLFNGWFNTQNIYLIAQETPGPPGNPNDPDQIPLGNGVVLLLIMSASFAVWKSQKALSNRVRA